MTDISNKRQPQLWLLAGGNGAGKSTFYQHFLAPKGVQFVNADLIAKKISPASPEEASYDAAKIAEYLRAELLTRGINFCFETVFSHPSKIDFIADAKVKGYQIIFVFVHLNNIDLNIARVSDRVVRGGHSVPVEKIENSIPRVIENVKKVLPLVDEFHLLDNSSAKLPYKQIVKIIDQKLIADINKTPKWALSLISNYVGNG